MDRDPDDYFRASINKGKSHLMYESEADHVWVSDEPAAIVNSLCGAIFFYKGIGDSRESGVKRRRGIDCKSCIRIVDEHRPDLVSKLGRKPKVCKTCGQNVPEVIR